MSTALARLPYAALLIAAAIFLCVCGIGDAIAAEDDLTFFRIGTGPTATTSYALGTSISAGISKPPHSPACDEAKVCGVPGLIAVAQSTESGFVAVESMVEGDLESAIVTSDIAYWAFSGGGPFANVFPVDDLRIIANLSSFFLHIVVDADSDIQTIHDLEGKRVSLGTEGSGTLTTALNVLYVHELARDRIEESYMKPGPAADALASGLIDAFFHVGALPDQVIRDLSQEVPIRLLSIAPKELEQLYSQYPFITGANAPQETYGFPEATRSVSINAKWVTLAHHSEDLIHKITRALWRGETRRIYERNNLGAGFSDERQAAWSIGIPLHPGAAAFYREAQEERRKNQTMTQGDGSDQNGSENTSLDEPKDEGT